MRILSLFLSFLVVSVLVAQSINEVPAFTSVVVEAEPAFVVAEPVPSVDQVKKVPASLTTTVPVSLTTNAGCNACNLPSNVGEESEPASLCCTNCNCVCGCEACGNVNGCCNGNCCESCQHGGCGCVDGGVVSDGGYGDGGLVDGGYADGGYGHSDGTLGAYGSGYTGGGMSAYGSGALAPIFAGGGGTGGGGGGGSRGVPFSVFGVRGFNNQNPLSKSY